jgi:cytochrome b subunit of formate dehydrogenase
VHRLAGVLLIASLLYHAAHVLRSRRNRRFLSRMWPRLADARDALAALRYNLGRSGAPPHFGVFSYAEKMEYWAYLWGTVVMAATGVILWASDFSLRHLPKWVSDVATTVHLYEAILATAAILVWHFYLVVFDPEVYPMERSWLTGRASGEHLRHHRPRYYRALRRLLARRGRS